jgi:hypothetical protein
MSHWYGGVIDLINMTLIIYCTGAAPTYKLESYSLLVWHSEVYTWKK